VVSSELLIGPVKAAIDRHRPLNSLIATSGAALPSGHAIAGAVTAVGLVLAVVPPGRARRRWEVRAGLALGWPALLMALRARRQPAGRATATR
jgi:undecaprenyl-diphosphatase